MTICGLKVTHDGAVALIEDGKLVFSIEFEKLDNNSRYKSIEDTAAIKDVLTARGVDLKSIDAFVIDGWGGYDQEALAIQPRLEILDDYNLLSASNVGAPYQFKVAQYEERDLKRNVLEEWGFDDLRLGDHRVAYTSTLHVAGHIMSAYCTSPFAANSESSYILVWDGGMYPRLYFFNAQTRQIENLGPLFLFIGNIYTIFSQHFGPFKIKNGFAKDDLSIAGKVMAYIALGEVKKALFSDFDVIYKNNYDNPMGFANTLAKTFKANSAIMERYSDQDILHTFHAYLEDMLIKKIEKKVGRYKRDHLNLCIAGGCGLNIKWNSAIRQSRIFDGVYVPPFPNDSGSAIGAACIRMFNQTGKFNLEWDVYCGADVIRNEPDQGWERRKCTVRELAHLLHAENEPVVFLNGKAELGPRALGNRSIIAPATTSKMKDVLNRIKQREEYRPVSPICLEQDAPGIFSPGTPDPFMLFDHQLRNDWADRIPAIRHLDGSARLQTVSEKANPVLALLLREYKSLSGIPVLCNTSANYHGKGFFPDVYSATQWNQTNYVWCEDWLFYKVNKISF